VDPMLVYTRLYLFEFEAGIRVKCKPMPVISFYPEIAYK